MNKKQVIRLNENQLYQMVKDCVRNIINEEQSLSANGFDIYKLKRILHIYGWQKDNISNDVYTLFIGESKGFKVYFKIEMNKKEGIYLGLFADNLYNETTFPLKADGVNKFYNVDELGAFITDRRWFGHTAEVGFMDFLYNRNFKQRS